MAEPDSRGPLPASRLVDTNVLIVASAVDAGSPFRPEGTPVDDAALRQRVFDWLEAFEADPARHAVLDAGWHVCGEYGHKLAATGWSGWMCSPMPMATPCCRRTWPAP